jgi:hypothetical protein
MFYISNLQSRSEILDLEGTSDFDAYQKGSQPDIFDKSSNSLSLPSRVGPANTFRQVLMRIEDPSILLSHKYSQLISPFGQFRHNTDLRPVTFRTQQPISKRY